MVISKENWEKLIKIPIKYLSNDVRRKIEAHQSVICAFSAGEKVEYLDGNGKWTIIDTPSFSEEVQYRVYTPVMPLSMTLQKDQAEAIKRLFEGRGLNSEERRIVDSLYEEFNKKFGSVFNKGVK